MAKEEAKKSCGCNEKECNCGEKCECKCGCGCGCCCGCKGKLLKLLALIIVFLAGIGCGCIMCCCGGCKSHHRVPAPIAMAKHAMHQPKNNVIIIRTDGDEVVPEVAKVNGDFRNFKQPNNPENTEVKAPVAPTEEPTSVEVEVEVAPESANVPAQEPAAPVAE